MLLTVTLPVRVYEDPNDPATISAAQAQALKLATVFTPLQYQGVTDGQHVWLTDAVPRANTPVTTANIAPALLPPNVT